ncbi:primosomal protein N' family DNA-binding protein [Dermabacter sp. HSID17554]|uniref:primosomal protein N' family DNA-binding protein n=1 Tax=Dermabacter sp. HSID17554 TaxID=2419511 RepID=UPI000F8785CA|nr:primosomal protein N' [Dermabacter sp. HSID17554]RUP87182.1 primosomal protein N' [Dermabacter sp. HSID17554]
MSVHVLGTLAHLDRAFEYAVPDTLGAVAPGMRVRVRFSGREHEALVRDRYELPETTRPLAPLLKIVSEDRLISEGMFRVCEEVAKRYAGSLSDVLRLAVPARSAAAEKAHRARLERDRDTSAHAPGTAHTRGPDPLPDERSYRAKFAGLGAFLEHSRGGEATPRAALVLDPVDSWISLVIEALRSLDSDAGAIILASDQRDVDRLARALTKSAIDHVQFGSAQGPHARYTAFLSALDGRARVVIGTRSAVFAPVRNLRMIVVWDPDDDLYEEPRAPYPHARTVALTRSFHKRCSLLYVSRAPSDFARYLTLAGTLAALEPVPAPHASTHPRIELMDAYLREREGASGFSRLPSHAHAVIRRGLAEGPVLVHVPRAGYAPALACRFCGTKATCVQCHATLAAPGRGELSCSVCARRYGQYRCHECGGADLRPLVLGQERTAADLKRSFPHATLHVSGGASGIVDDADVHDGDLVIATPGAEPQVTGKYAAAVIVDASASLGRAEYNADTETVRRYSHVIGATRTFDCGGQVLVVGPDQHPALRSLVLVRSNAFIDRVLEERTELGLPPSSKVIEVRGERAACSDFLERFEAPKSTEIFGPTEAASFGIDAEARVILRCPVNRASELVEAARATMLVRSAKKLPGSLRLQVDPPHVF